MKIWRAMLVILAVAALAAGSAYALTFTPAKANGKIVGGQYDPAGREPSVRYPSFLASPGESIDFTFYDYQHNGSHQTQIVLDSLGPTNRAKHVIYMKSINASHTPRNAAYQFNDGTGWSGELDANTQRAGYTTLGVLSSGRAVASFHQAGGAGNRSVVAIDAARGAGAFTVFNVDTVTFPPGTSAPIWPHVGIANNNNIIVAAHQQDGAPTGDNVYYATSTNTGTSFTRFTAMFPGDTLSGDIAQVVAGSRSGKVAVACPKSKDGVPNNQLNCDIRYIESTDNGVTWGSLVNVTNYLVSDTVRAYDDVGALYDNANNLHLVWCGTRWTGATSIWNSAAIFHWSAATGIDCVSGAGNITGTWWWDQDSAMGNWKRGADRPMLAIDPSTSYLYCVWTGQIVRNDIAANGNPNGDLYGAVSTDGGNTWRPRIGLTESHTPGCGPGSCDDDDYQSIATVVTDSVRILYINDKDAGGSVQTEGATVSCPVKYLAKVKSAFLGVEAGPAPLVKMPGSFELGVARPNPVGKTTEIQFGLPVPREVNLSVYTVTGQLVKTLVSGRKEAGYHSVRWDGSSAPAGVYLYRMTAGEFTQTRSLVVVR